MAQLDYSPLFDAALAEPIGLRVETNNPHQLQVTLCQWRQRYGLQAYTAIETCCTSEEDEIFLVKKSVELT
jgi:hypothetical protein